MKKSIILLALVTGLGTLEAQAKDCEGLPTHAALKKALIDAHKADNGGFNLDMWGTVVNRAGKVCTVVYTGTKYDSQWPGSRLISAQKANTANAFSLENLALSTANLYSATQPGGSLYGLQHSNPINTAGAYKGNAESNGSDNDPLVGERIGGVNVFGGGLALYNSKGQLVGALGVSGDSSCVDHNIAWRTRNSLKLDFVSGGVSAAKNDQIIYDVKDGKSAGGFGHVFCGGNESKISETLPATAVVQK
ncbi:heme-binding protein [Acinetobacter sp.]|uniref:GlcG/HbpS family heme-binding protein n=1 Tax=Acinetobacter sp. TaxID=472 RepID=UPI0035AF2245